MIFGDLLIFFASSVWQTLNWTAAQISVQLRALSAFACWVHYVSKKWIYTGWAIKNVVLYFCLYFRQLMTDFQNSFTSTLCGQFPITWLLYILPHRKCVSTLPCEIWMKYACTTIIANKHYGKILKKTLQINIAVNDLYNTRPCGSNTVYCHTDHSPQCWSEVLVSVT